MENETINMYIDNESIGIRIRQAREAMELTREQLAELTGISSYYLGQLERGERQMSLPLLVRISNTLHISLDYLILGKDSQDQQNTSEIEALIKKCSKKELELIKKLIKTILPYTN